MRHIRQSLTHFGKHLLFRVRVSGESCWPVLVPGKSYWASALAPVREGDFIVFRNPADRDRVFIKKILEVRGGGYRVGSSVSWGSSSGDFGIVGTRAVLGRIICIP